MNRALRAATIGVLLFTPVALSACSAGQINQTSTQNRDKYGAFAIVGDLTIRDAALAYPDGGSYAAGQDAELQMVVANPTTAPDVLLSISGPDFAGVRVAGTGTAPLSSSASGSSSSASSTGSAASSTSSAATSTSASASGGNSASSGATASGSVSTGSIATPSGSAQPLPTGALSTTSPVTSGPSDHVGITIPANTNVQLGKNVAHVFLTGLKHPVTAAGIVQITMTFQHAGTVTVPAIVTPPDTVLPQTSTYNFNQNEDKLRIGSAHGA